MNDETNDARDLTPAQEDSVRRLLSDARVTDPMPDDVRDRLDGLVRGLADERAMQRPAATVVDLAARRRARIRNLLVAAAAVVAIGVAAPPLLQGMGGTMDASSEGGSGDDSAAGSAEMEQSQPNGLDEDSAAETAPGATQFRPDAPRIRDGFFAADAEAARDQADSASTLADTQLKAECLPAVDLDAAATTIAVRFRGQDALLVLAPVAGGSQRASLYICGESTPRRTAQLDPR